jgi:hypothetical protein
MLGAAIAWGTAGVASASTAGSQSVPPPVASPLPPGGFSTIVTTQTVGPAGGTVGPVDVAGAEVTVHIPAGAFPADVQIVITAPDLGAVPPAPGFMVVAGVGIGVSINGTKYQGTFLKPITIDVASPKIDASSEVGVWTGSAFVLDSSSTLIAGLASITMDSDAAFIVQSPTSEKEEPVPGATAPVTGEPFLGEGIVAGLLVLGGTGAIFMSRRQRVKAASTGPAQKLPVREVDSGHLAADAPACPRHDNGGTGPREATKDRRAG